MKTKQTTIHRSAAKWLPGAMALAATTASSHAATVQITLLGNKISSTGGNQLFADLTGDSTPDITFGAAVARFASVYAIINTGIVQAYFAGGLFYADARFAGGFGVNPASAGSPVAATYLNPIFFTDTRINGGQQTRGWVEATAFNESTTSHTVQLTRLIFDDANVNSPNFSSYPGVQTEWQVSAVPEASSSLALLALGAGGLLTRRRTKRAA